MTKIPFKVSARTARLIGRENVSNADGAIIELVKNSYDADASICIIYFNNKYTGVPRELSIREYLKFRVETSQTKLIENCYEHHISKYILIKDLDEEVTAELKNFFRKKGSLYIVDNGEGMTREVIQNYWMTIGTDNKQNNIFSKNNRIKTGAKGIGRFALDRLGNGCLMYSLPTNSKTTFKWSVNWDDFETQGSVIDNVFADLEEIKNFDLFNKVNKMFSKFEQLKDELTPKKFCSGTIIKIVDLRDEWPEFFIDKIFSNLETLIPPKEEKIFDIYLVNSLLPEKYGRINSSLNDDYDYKLIAKTNENKAISVTIVRNEFDLNKIDKSLFDRAEMKNSPYDFDTFKKGEFTRQYLINELLPGYEENYGKEVLNEIGAFDFTFYFMKRLLTGFNEKKKFFYKDFNGSQRVSWLDKFGGVKLYRDFFRIRPYGEVNSSAFDWLNLGERAAKSPAAPSHRSGSWRVRSYQVYGVVNISRLTNINFEDKSSREGLQESVTFMAFKEIILRLIERFEKDRQYIMRAMDQLYEDAHKVEVNRKKAKTIAQKIIKDIEKLPIKEDPHEKDQDDQQTEVILAQQIIAYEKETEELTNELKLLRALASTGLAITSFSHELKNLSAKILPRTEDLKDVLVRLIDPNKLKTIKDSFNPLIMIDEFRNQDERLKFWLDFSLNAIRKDKRTRKKVDLYEVFRDFHKSWDSALKFEKVELKVPDTINKKCMIRFFLIDIDSIFNNLIANSLDAFKRKDAGSNREITIDLNISNSYLNIFYEDTGPGLSLDIQNPYDIFETFFTTKRDIFGKPIGTGLGMWIVRSTIEEYNCRETCHLTVVLTG